MLLLVHSGRLMWPIETTGLATIASGSGVESLPIMGLLPGKQIVITGSCLGLLRGELSVRLVGGAGAISAAFR